MKIPSEFRFVDEGVDSPETIGSRDAGKFTVVFMGRGRSAREAAESAVYRAKGEGEWNLDSFEDLPMMMQVFTEEITVDEEVEEYHYVALYIKEASA